MREYTWEWREAYGGPEVDEVIPKIEVTSVSEDHKKVRLKITPMTQGDVHELNMEGVRNSEGQPLLHSQAYYTLNEIPKK